jgi:hypothetical protein
MEVEQRLPAPLRATSAGPPSDEKTEAATATAVATVNVAPTSFGDEWDADGPEWSEGPVGALVTKDESERMTARLEHLVGVLAREREPVAPIDGVVITTPAEAVASSRAATAFAASVARDLDAVERGAGAKCPVTSLVTELQHTPGAGRLLHALPVDRKRRRFGADLPASEMTSEQALHDAVEWTTQTVASGLVNRLLQATPGSPDDELTENADLFEFQRQWSIRGDRLANVLTRGLAGSASGPWPLAGCYLVATGDPVGGGQAFGGGALRSLLERTPSSEWTDSALRRDARQNRTVAAGWASLSAAGVVVACLLLL